MTRALAKLAVSALAAAVAVSIAAVSDAAVTACVSSPGVEGLCSSSSGTCTISATKNIDPGAVIDCGGRDIVVTGSGTKVIVTAGAFTLKARSLTLGSGRSILANGHDSIRTGVRLELSQNLVVSGDILARNGGGDSFIDIVVAGSATLDGSSPVIALDGTAQNADGGELLIDAGDFIRISKLVDASGKAGGTSANQNGGGDVTLRSGSDIFIDAEVRSFGRWYNGGNVNMAAAGDVTISYVAGTGQPKGQVIADGRSTDGDGGHVSIVAGDKVEVKGPINVAGGTNANGGDASGGSVDIDAGCGGILIADPIDATGGWSGGEITLSSDSDVTISDILNLEARQGSGGGGRLSVNAKGAVTITNGAWVTAWGHSASVHEGNGGRIGIAGCSVDVQGGSILEAIGHRGGLIELRGRKSPASQSQFSVRVSSSAIVDAGKMGVGNCEIDGRIFLDVRSPGPGVCSNATSQACNSRIDCPTNGECINPPGNPDTGGVNSQFYPTPRKRLQPELLACSTTCN